MIVVFECMLQHSAYSEEGITCKEGASIVGRDRLDHWTGYTR